MIAPPAFWSSTGDRPQIRGSALVVVVEHGARPGEVEAERRQPELRRRRCRRSVVSPVEAAAHRHRLDQRPPHGHPGGEERDVLDQVHDRVLDRRLVEGRDVPEVHQAEPDRDPRPRRGERAERALDAHQPPGDRPQDHAREREQQQRRRDVAQQHVLEHVRGEEVVLAEPVERAGDGEQQRERSRRRTPRPAAGRRRGRPPRRGRGGSGARRSPPAPRSGPARTGRGASGGRDRYRARARLSQPGGEP